MAPQTVFEELIVADIIDLEWEKWRWKRMIGMGDENARIKPFDQDRRARAALSLAEAQVQLQRVRRA